MIDDKDSVQLSEDCFSVCEALKVAIRGNNPDNLDESIKMALEDSKRCVYWPRPRLLPYQEAPGLHAKSSGLSGGGRTCHTVSMARARLRGTSWRSEGYSLLSTHSAQTWIKVPPTLRPFILALPQPLYMRVVRLQPRSADPVRNTDCSAS